MNIYDGKIHYLKGLSFYYSNRDLRISFYVAEIPGKKRKSTRVDMYKEQNHGRPHVHIDDHEASFAIDVITSVGLLQMFAVVAQIPDILQAVKEGKSIKVSKGDFSVDVTSSEQN